MRPGVWTDSDYPQAMRMELRGDSEPYFPVSKPAAPGKLVGNLEHLPGSRVPSIAVSGPVTVTGIAQSFTTGGAGKLRSVRLDGGFSSATRVSIYSDFEAAPGSKLRELLNPSALSTTRRVHEFHAGKFDLALRPNTIYWVVLEGAGSLETTTDTGESGLTGWSISDGARARQNGVWVVIQVGHTNTARMEILGFSSDPAPKVTGHASIGTQGTDCVWRPGETVDLTPSLQRDGDRRHHGRHAVAGRQSQLSSRQESVVRQRQRDQVAAVQIHDHVRRRPELQHESPQQRPEAQRRHDPEPVGDSQRRPSASRGVKRDTL